MDRRTFLKLAGMGSLAFASACTLESEKNLYSLVRIQDDMVSGEATWYASTCRQCPAGCGVLAKNREGRVIKLEGNPLHPVNKGKLCIRGQAAVQEVYHPDRLKKPLIRQDNTWKTMDYDEAVSLLAQKASKAAARADNRVRMLTEIEGDARLNLFQRSLDSWGSRPPTVFEPFSHENLREANHSVFGINGIPSYRMEDSDVLAGFGADFCETWLSPVEYSRKFKQMHAFAEGGKGRFFHVSPWRGITGANSDAWISCAPDTEAVVCLGLIRRILKESRAGDIPEQAGRQIREIAEPFDREKVMEISGIDPDLYDLLEDSLLQAKNPLVTGTSAPGRDLHGLHAHIAVNLLNYLLDPDLGRIDFTRRHRAEKADTHAEAISFFRELESDPADVVFLNNVNPVYALAGQTGIKESLEQSGSFVACFSNFMDETAQCADLVLPVSLALESWDEYGAYPDLLSLCQPAMKPLHGAPSVTEVFLRIAPKAAENRETDREELIFQVQQNHGIDDEKTWMEALSRGGLFDKAPRPSAGAEKPALRDGFKDGFSDFEISGAQKSPQISVLPSVRFFDGRNANLPWLCEIPDPVTQVAWQSPVLVHPATAREMGIEDGNLVRITGSKGEISAPASKSSDIHPGVLGVQAGQGHTEYGRYAKGQGANPFTLFYVKSSSSSATALYETGELQVESAGVQQKLASTAGSLDPHGRKIALTVSVDELLEPEGEKKHGLAMHDFPLTLPLPEGYDEHRDFYPPHDHDDYRWAMTVDLDRCIGCSACAAACYAENNLAVAGEKQIINGREMSWLHIERYWQIEDPASSVFLPMLCQHCDNAPCESVCPVYAPHHSKEGLNNQIYNRCIGTRFCAQNCPYKVRRFNWFDWKWPEPLNLQLNPDVTVRSKGVMEKCSFCVQRIKQARGRAKNEDRKIKDGEVTPACVQTCPTDALVFGSLMDSASRVSQMVKDRRAYQVMGYLNTKPAVIYLKKVVHAV
ncbi:MAG: 4Fe-4S dicluster domain-containing protein [Desulfobacterales bacterium]